MAAPATRIISLTITEGGYNINDTTGEFDMANPDVLADLEPGAVPRTTFGLITEALSRRRKRGQAPFTVMSCDNLQDNGYRARRAFTAFARLRDPDLAAWVEREVRFPNSMVDRITPVTTDADRAEIQDRFGIEDQWPVVCEPYTQWVLEDAFGAGRPPYADAGVQVVDHVESYELMKLRLLNGSHQAMAYFAYLCGYRLVHEAAQDPLFQAFLLGYMNEEATPTLPPVPGVDLTEYKHTLIERFSNPQVRDTIARLCAESSDRIPKWLLPVVRQQLATGGEIRHSAAVRLMTGASPSRRNNQFDQIYLADDESDKGYRMRDLTIGDLDKQVKFYLLAQQNVKKMFDSANILFSSQPLLHNNAISPWYRKAFRLQDTKNGLEADKGHLKADLDSYMTKASATKCANRLSPYTLGYFMGRSALRLEQAVATWSAESKNRDIVYTNAEMVFPGGQGLRLPYFIDNAHMSDLGQRRIAMIGDRADRDILDRIGRLLEEERRLTGRIGAALNRMRRVVAADAVDAADLEYVALADDRDRHGRDRKHRLRRGLRPCRGGLCGGAGQRQRAGGQHGPAVEIGHERSPWCWLIYRCSPIHKKGPAMTRALVVTAIVRSVLDLGRQLAAIGRELGHHLLVQPDVHAGRIVGVAGVAELLGELLARGEAGVDIERLHQVDDRGPPLQLLPLRGDRLVEDGRHIDCRPGGSRRRGGRRRCAAGGSRARGRSASGRGARAAAEDRAHDFSEYAHRSLPKELRRCEGQTALGRLTTVAVQLYRPLHSLPMRHSLKRECFWPGLGVP